MKFFPQIVYVSIKKYIVIALLSLLTLVILNQNFKENPFIAKLYLDGMINNESDFLEKIKQLKQNNNFKALLIIVNSPGGTFVSSKEIYDSLKLIDEKIPVAVYMKEVATSGAYLVSLGADKIFANTGTITGSIGVILQTIDITLLLDKIGINPLTAVFAPDPAFISLGVSATVPVLAFAVLIS